MLYIDSPITAKSIEVWVLPDGYSKHRVAIDRLIQLRVFTETVDRYAASFSLHNISFENGRICWYIYIYGVFLFIWNCKREIRNKRVRLPRRLTVLRTFFLLIFPPSSPLTPIRTKFVLKHGNKKWVYRDILPLRMEYFLCHENIYNEVVNIWVWLSFIGHLWVCPAYCNALFCGKLGIWERKHVWISVFVFFFFVFCFFFPLICEIYSWLHDIAWNAIIPSFFFKEWKHNFFSSPS